MTTLTHDTSQLTATDRCDRCGVQAYVQVRLHSGLDLLFCAHHYTVHAKALEPMVAALVDESDRLMQPPVV